MGHNPDEPNARKFCEVIQIGIEEDTAEVTLFYTPERGLGWSISIFCTMIWHEFMQWPLNARLSLTFLEFQVSNGYKVEEKEETNYGRRYRRLKLVTSKANVIEVRRYSNSNGGRSCWWWERFHVLSNTYLYEFSTFSSKNWTTSWTPTEKNFILREEKWKSERKLKCFVSTSARLADIFKILLYEFQYPAFP